MWICKQVKIQKDKDKHTDRRRNGEMETKRLINRHSCRLTERQTGEFKGIRNSCPRFDVHLHLFLTLEPVVGRIHHPWTHEKQSWGAKAIVEIGLKLWWVESITQPVGYPG